MSYRLVDANALAIKYPDVNDMVCIYADLPNGLDGGFYTVLKLELDEIVKRHEEIGYEHGLRDGYAQAVMDAVDKSGADMMDLT